MRNAICSLYFITGAIIDGRRKKISTFYLCIGIWIATLFSIMDIVRGEFHLAQIILQLIPGVIFLLYSKLTNEKIGHGDGIFLIISGVCLPYPRLWYVWILALILLVFWAGYLWLIRKAGKNKRIPFLPFLCLADLLIWGISYV